MIVEKQVIRPKRGEVWYHRPSYTTGGRIQQGPRPVIIVSNDKCNEYSPVLLAVPCTTKPKKNLPTHVLFTIDGEFNTALVEQSGPILLADLENKKYGLDTYLMDQVDQAIKVAYGLTNTPPMPDVLED